MKTIKIQYYAVLREKRGVDSEEVMTEAETPKELYEELQKKYSFLLDSSSLRVAVNDEFSTWDISFSDGDTVVFIPPVSGG